MKLWTLRQEWNEKERDKAFEAYVKSEIEGSLSFEEMLDRINLLPGTTKDTTTYLELVLKECDYKKFCQTSKNLMRRMPKGRYEVIVTYENDPNYRDGTECFNERVRNYLYATLNIDEVIS